MNNELNRNCECECNDVKPQGPKEPSYAASGPYPPVRICERNRAYGRMMLDNMGGQNSEMSAVSLYVYNNLLIDEDARLSGIFHKISIVEMHHLHIFGEIARMMGENPRLWTYRGNQMTYWSPSYNNYPIEIRPLLTNALNGERKTVQKYEEQCRRIKDIHIVECLKRIIQDEEIHIHIFESLLEEYCR